jgi:glycosyltransferase involved in cell wall biosynthesis
MPVVSIITPLFNKGDYIAETIASVRAQTVTDWEMIVVDNGSTDDGAATVRKLRANDARVHFVEFHARRGPGAARNCGLSLARCEWVQFLDADDLLEPDHLATQLACARSCPEADLIACCWQEFEDGSAGQRTLRRPPGWGGDIEELMTIAIAYAPWAVHAVLVRRALLNEERIWPEEFDRWPSEDSAFWFPLLLQARIAWSSGAGALYRIKTADSRNEIRDVAPWIEGLCHVVDRNVAAFAAAGKEPSAAQCETILRTFENKYRLAKKLGQEGPARVALARASDWLRRCPANSAAIAGRKVLGIANTARLSRLARAMLPRARPATA